MPPISFFKEIFNKKTRIIKNIACNQLYTKNIYTLLLVILEAALAKNYTCFFAFINFHSFLTNLYFIHRESILWLRR